MSSLKARMVALKKGMGIGTADIKGTKLPHAAAATDAGAIQQHLALVIHVRCFSLFLMRPCLGPNGIFVLCTCSQSVALSTSLCSSFLQLSTQRDRCMSLQDAKAVAASKSEPEGTEDFLWKMVWCIKERRPAGKFCEVLSFFQTFSGNWTSHHKFSSGLHALMHCERSLGSSVHTLNCSVKP